MKSETIGCFQNGKSWVQHRALVFACVELASWAFIISHLILIRAPHYRYNCAHIRSEKMDCERLKHPKPCSQNMSGRRCVWIQVSIVQISRWWYLNHIRDHTLFTELYVFRMTERMKTKDKKQSFKYWELIWSWLILKYLPISFPFTGTKLLKEGM